MYNTQVIRLLLHSGSSRFPFRSHMRSSMVHKIHRLQGLDQGRVTRGHVLPMPRQAWPG